MNNLKLVKPVAIIVFNRPDLTKKLLDRLSEIKINKLYVIMDSARDGNIDDVKSCNEVMKLIKGIDFANEIIINKADLNLGCKTRLITGLNWLFKKEESAIILEDDCCPSSSFVYFCSEMLETYKSNENIGLISGTNFYSSNRTSDEYYFSKYANIWGWASWRRVWNLFDENLVNWNNEVFKQEFKERCFSNDEFKHWNAVFKQTALGNIDTWDYQFMLTIFSNFQLSIVPNVNLIDNLGFGHANATHTGDPHPSPESKSGDIIFPLKKKSEIVPNSDHDLHMQKLLYKLPPLYLRVLNRIKYIYQDPAHFPDYLSAKLEEILDNMKDKLIAMRKTFKSK